METNCVTTTPGDSSVTLSSLQELTVYNVSVQAVNSGGPSKSLTAAVRMVTVDQLGRTEVQHLLCFFERHYLECLALQVPFTSSPLSVQCIHAINVCSYSEMLLMKC